MTDALVRSAGDFLVDVAQRMAPDCAADVLRTALRSACAGRLNARGPDGRRASQLTSTGMPFEISLTGGRGARTPAVRYGTEIIPPGRGNSARFIALSAAIRELAALLPVADRSVVETIETFLEAIYPLSLRQSARKPLWTWLGVVHHAALPHRLAGLKVYGTPNASPGAFERLCRAWPGFEEVLTLPDDEKYFAPIFVAIEIDALGEVTEKAYLRPRCRDVVLPMKLVRSFGDPAWEVLRELVECGVDAAGLYKNDFIACRARRGDRTTFTLSFCPRRGENIDELASELAARHHGTLDAIDAMTHAAKTTHATVTFSVLGLGFSPESGIDKFTVYGTPTWDLPERGMRLPV
ncbi:MULTISPECIES: hypothetical protein [Nocardia]|uniref:hypothetical protein n=1 Tax=Nocardia TaxID=1817 RepID=UPI0007E9B86F|nr:MULTISPECIES: hypothetical protein [Nocardia]MBF6274826.1 hypothetical protein [Nocardia nova]OBA53276.1 hypothetical protein A5789_24145 [Nocardia sp. 852002-51101_SCH5132738]OBB29571.1 hypothetical protein A5748_09905 [Nocardia sp. 852002-51244_SCH5132740]OBF66066.1 hypothetical protein A9X06_07000 [Mycobacterium sp. 852002-51759_SCH5129042]